MEHALKRFRQRGESPMPGSSKRRVTFEADSSRSGLLVECYRPCKNDCARIPRNPT